MGETMVIKLRKRGVYQNLVNELVIEEIIAVS